ncbi:hypothetical protein SK128_001705, partial [Halocaridina rubra]
MCSNGALIRGAHPALSGTNCGYNLVCSAGSCSGKLDTPTQNIPTSPTPGDGSTNQNKCKEEKSTLPPTSKPPGLNIG